MRFSRSQGGFDLYGVAVNLVAAHLRAGTEEDGPMNSYSGIILECAPLPGRKQAPMGSLGSSGGPPIIFRDDGPLCWDDREVSEAANKRLSEGERPVLLFRTFETARRVQLELQAVAANAPAPQKAPA